MVELEARGTEEIATRDRAIDLIATKLGVRTERGKRFADLTSLRVGGAVDCVLSPQTEQQAAALVHELEQQGIAWRALVLAHTSPRRKDSAMCSPARAEIAMIVSVGS